MDELVLFIIFCVSSFIVAITLLYAIYLNATISKVKDQVSNLTDHVVTNVKVVQELKDQTDRLSKVIDKQDTLK